MLGKYLASKRVSLSSKSIWLGKTPSMDISKALFPAIIPLPVREARMTIHYNQKNSIGDHDDLGEAREKLGKARNVMFPIKIIKKRKDRGDGEGIFGVAPAEPRRFIDRDL